MSLSRALACGVVVGSILGAASHADANPFSGGGWVWTSYESRTDPGTVSNASGFSDPGSSSTLVIPSATAAVSSSNTVTNAGNSSFAVSAPSSSAPAGSSSSSSSAAADAFINFGTGPYPEASTLTSGGAEAWYLSPTVEHVFGGVPNAQQQSDFTSQVLKDVQQTFSLSGLSPILTTDPTVSANHTISVVANTSYSPNPNAIGITDVGNNGFSFIDNLNSAQSVTDLEWAVAHNIAHELMHAFGVAVHHDQTGTYLDAATASWSLLTDPNTVFSPAAVQDILSHNYGRSSSSGALGAEQIDGDQTVTAQPVPEPSTLALWGMLGVGARVARRRRRLVA